MTKIKLYKDPNRGKQETYKPYVPAYVVAGLEPQEIAAAHVPAAQAQLTRHAPVVSRDNPRIRPAPTFRVSVPYADVPSETSPIGPGPLPNNGNNIETSWASVDAEDFDNVIIDEEPSEKLDPNRPMIDNNDDDEVNYRAIPSQIRSAPVPVNPLTLVDDQDDEEVEYHQQAPSSLNIGEDEYVLVIANSVVSIGSLAVVQEEVRALIFGEHQLNQTNNITPDDIIVLKRVKIKVGVFLE